MIDRGAEMREGLKHLPYDDLILLVAPPRILGCGSSVGRKMPAGTPAVLGAKIGGLWLNLLHFRGALFRTTAFLRSSAVVGWVWSIRLRT